ncbi:MAG: hypothetical protein F6K56_39035 [Moorea sp. SIO3G5]|nr:hypothetical protein [Moorena sp. SIO3G5]
MRYTGFFPSCPPPLLRGVRGDSSCLLPLAYSLFPVPCSLSPHLPISPSPRAPAPHSPHLPHSPPSPHSPKISWWNSQDCV